MQKHDVARPDQPRQSAQILIEHPLVVLVLGGVESGSAVHRAVERVVNPLGDREERWVTVEHEPSGVHPRAKTVGEQGLQHLRDTTAWR